MTLIKSQIDKRSQNYTRNVEENNKLIAEWEKKTQATIHNGKERTIKKFRDAGKLLPRERLDALLDPGSPFLELSTLAGITVYDDELVGASLITGVGFIEGRAVMVYCADPLVKGGSSTPITIKKYLRAQEFALQFKLPGVHLVESAGANLMYAGEVFVPGGEIFKNITRHSAKGLPQISVVFGSSTAGGAYIPALCDEVIMVKDQAMIYLGGPPLVKWATQEIATDEELGGAQMHTQESGVSDQLANDDAHGIMLARESVKSLPPSELNFSAHTEHQEPLYANEELLGIVSSDPRFPFDCKEVIARLVDGSDFDEFKPLFGTTLVTGFAKIHGLSIGIIANNGILFSESALKATHFIELCEQRRIPLVYLSNVSGFMVGKEYERGGIVKHGAKMINAVSNATVPQFTIIIGGAHGAGYYAMCGRPFEPAYIGAWPNSKTSIMGPDQGAGVLAEIRKKAVEAAGETWTSEMEENYKAPIKHMFAEQASPYYATGRLYDDGIIDPRRTRMTLALLLGLSQPLLKEKVADQMRFGTFRM
ncbi:MAG: methylcrotonoyl-CoA carboxylase [Deltaproteobacteria bacterium]|nr:methylcrotonoyl-CoA carboxylase [Deltaproteobacteria bacterium]